jgi:hypothetical protein
MCNAFAIAVRDGFTAPMLGKKLVSATQRLSSPRAQAGVATTRCRGGEPPGPAGVHLSLRRRSPRHVTRKGRRPRLPVLRRGPLRDVTRPETNTGVPDDGDRSRGDVARVFTPGG